MFHFGSKEERGETLLTHNHRFETSGRIAVVILVLVVSGFLLSAFAVPHANELAFVVTGVFVILSITLRSWLKRRKLSRLVELRKQLGELEKQKSELRVREARESGQFDRWEKQP